MNTEAGRSRSVSANSASSNRSWKKFLKHSKIEPDECLGSKCKSITIPLDKDRVIRVLQTEPNSDDLRRASPKTLQLCEEKRTVFFIHGVGGSADLWKKQINYFSSRGYETVSPDLLGHGKSSKPHTEASYSFHNLAKDMLQIFDMFKRKRNILVGHSYGASFVTMIARERSSSVSKVILISGGPPTSLKPERFSIFCLPILLFAPIKPLVVKKYRSMAFHASVKDNIAFTLPAFVLKSVMQGQHWPEGDEEYHSDLLVPVLLIYGNNDKFVTVEEERWTEAIIYGSKLEIVEEAGHMVMLERPDVVNQMILRFLNRDASTRSLVDLSQSPSAINREAATEEEEDRYSNHVVHQFVNRDLLNDEVSGTGRPTSRAASRLSKHGGSEKRTKIGL